MSRLPSSKTAKIWAERIAQCERSNAPVAQFCQSIGCSPTSYYQWKRKLAAKPQATAFLRVQTSDSTVLPVLKVEFPLIWLTRTWASTRAIRKAKRTGPLCEKPAENKGFQPERKGFEQPTNSLGETEIPKRGHAKSDSRRKILRALLLACARCDSLLETKPFARSSFSELYFPVR